MIKKNRLLGLFFICLSAGLFAQTSELKADTYLPGDTILIASEPDYPPFCFVDENNNAAGFSIDLFNAAAEAVGLKVRTKIGVWTHIRQELENGNIDALPLVGRTPEREALYDFSMPYLSLHGAVFVRKGTRDIHSLQDLKNKDILVMEGDNAEEFARREQISEHIHTTNTFEEAFRLLSAGEFDAVITQRVMGLKLLETIGVNNVEPLNFQIPGFRQDFCFAVQKGNAALLTHLNEGLSIIIANGTYAEIRSEWFGPADQLKLSPRQMIRFSLYIIIPMLFAGTLGSVIFLRREIKKKTAHLSQEIEEHKRTLSELKKQQQLLEEKEQEVRLLLNSTAEGIYGLDNNGNCSFVNKSALELLKINDEDTVIGKNMHQLIRHSNADGSLMDINECGVCRAFLEGIGTHSVEDMFWRADGTFFETEYFSYPIRRGEEVLGAVVTFWDISERKQADRELRSLKESLEKQVRERTAELHDKLQKLDKSQKAMLYMVEDLNRTTNELQEERKKLELSNRELEAFTYSVSHDLRAPLRAVNGYSQFLLEDYANKLDDEGKRFIRTIRENANRMDELISDLLNLSRVSRTELNLSLTDMAATAASMYQEVASDEEKKSFKLLIHKMPQIDCDPSLIKQVWQNLIGNALKYSMHAENKTIEIGHREEPEEIWFYIKDQGAGFNMKYVDKIFGLFQRLHREDEYEGTGVGLAIVKRIVQRHGGKVKAESEEGKGAAFYFSLPKTSIA